MSRPASHKPAALHGAIGRRLIVIVMVAALGALLGVPATAGAHVDPKYRAQYKATLGSYDRLFHNYVRHFGLLEDSVTSLADQMQPLIGDPDPVARENLLGLEHMARIDHDNLEKLMPEWDKTLKKSFYGFRIKAYRWFDAKSDRRRFLKQANLMDIYFRYLLTVGAYPRLSQAALLLSNDPTDLTPARQKIAEAADAAATAHTDVHEVLAALRKLR
jgi:hypothetical protein